MENGSQEDNEESRSVEPPAGGGRQVDGNFSIEFATSGRSKCQHCKKIISMGEVRIFRQVHNFHHGQEYMKRHYHPTCLFEGFSRARVASSVFSSLTELVGFDKMPGDVKAHISELLQKSKPNPSIRNKEVRSRNKNVCVTDCKFTRRSETRPLLKSQGNQDGKNKLRVLYTNADVLTAPKMIELRELVKIEKPHIIAINEVLPKNSQVREEQDYVIAGFSLHRWVKGRGINIWTHTSLDKSVSIPTTKNHVTEAGCIDIRLQGGDSLRFSCMYRSGSQSEESNRDTNKLLLDQAKCSTHLKVCGDFNYKNINWQLLSCNLDEQSNEQKFLNAVQDGFLHTTNRLFAQFRFFAFSFSRNLFLSHEKK